MIDTAGLRQTDDIVEKEGIERSYQEAQNAGSYSSCYRR